MPNKTRGGVLIAGGLIFIVWALGMDVSQSGYFNFHKASQQSNKLMLGGILLLAGIIVSTLARSKKDPPTVAPCAPDLSQDGYKIWLVSRFQIEKNEVLGGLTCDGRIFPSLDEALQHADSLYQSELRDAQVLAENNHAKAKASIASRERMLKAVQRMIPKLLGSALGLAFIILIASYVVGKINEASTEKRKAERTELLSQMYSSRTMFGYVLGENNFKQLSDTLTGERITIFDEENLSCRDVECIQSLKDFQVFWPEVWKVDFRYCKSSPTERRLAKVILYYEDDVEAARDLGVLKRRYIASGPDLSTRVTPTIEKGKWLSLEALICGPVG